MCMNLAKHHLIRPWDVTTDWVHGHFLWNCSRVMPLNTLMIKQIWFRQWHGAVQRPVIGWTNKLYENGHNKLHENGHNKLYENGHNKLYQNGHNKLYQNGHNKLYQNGHNKLYENEIIFKSWWTIYRTTSKFFLRKWKDRIWVNRWENILHLKYYIHLLHNCFLRSRLSRLIISGVLWSKTSIRKMTWWRHQMETFFAFLVLFEGNPPVTGGFSSGSQRPVTQSFDVFFDMRMNKRFSKRSKCRRFEMLCRSLWRHWNEFEKCTCKSTSTCLGGHWIYSLLEETFTNRQTRAFYDCIVANLGRNWCRNHLDIYIKIIFH